MIETEIKLPLQNPDEVREKLLHLGFSKEALFRMRDVYFDNEAGLIRGSHSALRLREVCDLDTGKQVVQMNYKGPKIDTLTMTRPEYEIGIDDFDAGMKILEALGFHGVPPFVTKTREELVKGDMTACLDNVEGLGHFLELEVLVATEKEKEDALHRIEEVLRELGYGLTDTVTTSYMTMLERQ